MRLTTRQAIGVFAAPVVGAAAMVAWEWTRFYRAASYDVAPMSVSNVIRSVMPSAYDLPLFATFTVIVILTRRQRHDLKSFVGAGIIAGVAIGMLTSVVVTLSEMSFSALGERSVFAYYWHLVPGAAIIGTVMTLPSVVVYWLMVEAGGLPDDRRSASE